MHMMLSLLQWCQQASSMYTSIQISKGYYSATFHKSPLWEHRAHISIYHIRSRLDSKAQHCAPPAVCNKKLANCFSDNTGISPGQRILLMCHPVEGILPYKQETKNLAPVLPPPPILTDISKQPETFSIHRLTEIIRHSRSYCC